MPNRFTISEAASEIQAGSLSPLELLDACLLRIHAHEETLKAWVTLTPEDELRALAKSLTEELGSGRSRGPLHGIPIGIKDIMFTKGMRTSSGSKLLRDFIPDYDATIVHRLRSAGAIVLGKTVTTEFACFDPAETCNPWNPDHTPGGSSSGSAAAVASRMCPGALGSQTGGSITRPATYCGIAGLKPTLGRVPVRGVFPVSYNLDHPGPLARSVADLAILFDTIAGPDPEDPFCSDRPLDNDPLEEPDSPPRIGVLRDHFFEQADESVLSIVEGVLSLFKSAGASIQDIRLDIPIPDVHRFHRILMTAELAEVHAERFNREPDGYAAGIRGLLEEGTTYSAVQHAEARKRQLSFRSHVQSQFSACDILLTPATATPAPSGLGSTGDPGFNSPWSYAGIPTVSLPVDCTSDGLPVGIQLIGFAFAEPDLFSHSSWCESHLAWDRAPDLDPI